MPPLAKLERTLKEQAARSVYIETDNEGGNPYIVTPFVFPDGDEPVIAVVPCEDGWLITDRGNTLFRLSGMLDEREYDRPDTQRKIDAAIAMARISKRGGALTRPLSERDCVEEVFEFAYALMRIDQLGYDAKRPIREKTCAHCAHCADEATRNERRAPTTSDKSPLPLGEG